MVQLRPRGCAANKITLSRQGINVGQQINDRETKITNGDDVMSHGAGSFAIPGSYAHDLLRRMTPK